MRLNNQCKWLYSHFNENESIGVSKQFSGNEFPRSHFFFEKQVYCIINQKSIAKVIHTLNKQIRATPYLIHKLLEIH